MAAIFLEWWTKNGKRGAPYIMFLLNMSCVPQVESNSAMNRVLLSGINSVGEAYLLCSSSIITSWIRVKTTFRATMLKYDTKSEFTVWKSAYGSRLFSRLTFWLVDCVRCGWDSRCSHYILLSSELSIEEPKKSCSISTSRTRRRKRRGGVYFRF